MPTREGIGGGGLPEREGMGGGIWTLLAGETEGMRRGSWALLLAGETEADDTGAGNVSSDKGIDIWAFTGDVLLACRLLRGAGMGVEPFTVSLFSWLGDMDVSAIGVSTSWTFLSRATETASEVGITKLGSDGENGEYFKISAVLLSGHICKVWLVIATLLSGILATASRFSKSSNSILGSGWSGDENFELSTLDWRFWKPWLTAAAIPGITATAPAIMLAGLFTFGTWSYSLTVLSFRCTDSDVLCSYWSTGILLWGMGGAAETVETSFPGPLIFDHGTSLLLLLLLPLVAVLGYAGGGSWLITVAYGGTMSDERKATGALEGMRGGWRLTGTVE